MATKPLPSPEVLRQLLSYDPETGKLFWKEWPQHTFLSGPDQDRYCRRWNTIYSGKQAMQTIESKGYCVGRVQGATQKAHRVAWAIHFGEWPVGQIDHINGIKTDNRIANLREVTPAGNSQNRPKRCDNSTGITGVFRRKAGWSALIVVNQKHIWLGAFPSKAEAASARKEAEMKYGFHPNHGRV